MAQRAENQARFYSSCLTCFRSRFFDDLHHVLCCKSLLSMQERSKTYFCVEHVVSLQLFKYVEGHQAQPLFCLHQSNALRSSSEEICQVRAPGRSNKIMQVFFPGDGRI